MTDKMQIYNEAREVPAEAQKQFSNGSFSGTDINPMWRIKKLTELFGPAGVGWYYEVLSERSEEHHDTTMAIVDLNLYIKMDGEWSKPIFGTGGNVLVKPTKSGLKASDEGYKMALTDALSVACKALGIGADIWFANDVTKYTAKQSSEKPTPDLDYTQEVTPADYRKAKEEMITDAQVDAIMKAAEKFPELAQHIADKYGGLPKMTKAQATKLLGQLAKKEART